MTVEGKIMIFVSTGRCGTVRLSEILAEKLPDLFSVVHQMRISRFSNILGNILYHFKDLNSIKKRLYKKVLKNRSSEFFIITDPLTSLVIPDEVINSSETAIIHIYRDSKEFAQSFFQFSRKRMFSFIAHNFIPFWQLNIYPLQNLFLGKRIMKRYEKTAVMKNNRFVEKYRCNKHFVSITMKDVFTTDIINIKINEFFETNIELDKDDFKIRSNTSN